MNDTRILFIVPPYVGYDSFMKPAFNDGVMKKKSGEYRNIVSDIPIGPLSLSAYVKKYADVEVRLIDFNVVIHKLEFFGYKSFSEMFNEILSGKEFVDYDPSIICVSTLFTPAYRNMIDHGRVIRNLFPSAFITAGGGVPTNMHRHIFAESDCFDALCYGEGEKPLLGYIQASDKRGFLEAHPAWITKEKSASMQLFQFDFVENLDDIPFLDYGIISIQDYRINSILSTYPFAKGKTHSMPIMASRGCTHHCCFCSSHTVHGRKMRYHSVSRVREDFERFKEQYETETIVFFDDHFMADRRRFFELIDVMNGLGLTAFFPSSLALYALDRKALAALKSVGLNQIVLSIESGSDRVLKEVMHKPLNLSIVNRVITDCRELGLDTDANILIGLPGETKRDIEDARAFLKTVNATWFRINIATPLVGSEMFATCVENDYLKGNYIDCDYKRAIVGTPEFTPEWLQEKVYAMNLELNFVCNSDVRLGNYAKALQGFENAIRVKRDHALAYYYAAVCYEKLCEADKADEYLATARAIVARDEFWRHYADTFNVPI